MNCLFSFFYQINNSREEQNSIPGWAKSEHLERIVPLNELWGIRSGKEKKDLRRDK